MTPKRDKRVFGETGYIWKLGVLGICGQVCSDRFTLKTYVNKALAMEHEQWTDMLSEQCELTTICEQVRQALKKQLALPGKNVLVRMIEETVGVDVKNA